MKKYTKKSLDAALAPFDIEKRPSMACSLLGHTKISSYFFGYISCVRCDATIGDNLSGAFDASDRVFTGHPDDCGHKKCQQGQNIKSMTWRDRYLVKKEHLPPYVVAP